MSLKAIKNVGAMVLPPVLLLSLAMIFPACGGGSSGGGNDAISGFNNRSTNLYTEAPAIYVTGNKISGASLQFYPKGSVEAGLCDTNNDGQLDTKINSIQSFVNAANNIFKEEMAACIAHGSVANPVLDHYSQTDIWDSVNERPDVMPEYAIANPPGGDPTTDGTQFVQIVFPFNINPASLFNLLNVQNNYCSDEITFVDEDDTTVECSVFLAGQDANGVYYNPATTDWPADAVQAQNVIVIVANQRNAGGPLLPSVPTAFTSTSTVAGQWDTNDKEIYLRIGTLQDTTGQSVTIDSKHLIRRYGVSATDTEISVKVDDIIPSDMVRNPHNNAYLEDQWPGITFGTYETRSFVSPDVTFQIVFNKPVVPVTVGTSVVFNKAPFNGNMAPLANIEAMTWPTNPACATPIEPICTNVAVKAYFVDELGVQSSVATPIPIRVYPLSQNNMAKYIINPLIDLPGSSTTWSGDPIMNESATPPSGAIRMRLQVIVYEYMLNDLTGDPDGKLLNGTLSREPQNLCVGGFHGERFLNNGSSYSKTFSIQLGRRYVNAPVSPNVMYYAMDTKGIGAIDLDGTGMTTNTPGEGRSVLVTNTPNFSVAGSSVQGDGNPYLYPVGLGLNTPIPGVNCGSNGWFRDLDPLKDALVRDSFGRAQLYPDPDNAEQKYVNISDIEVGDFLDTIYYNRTNRYNTASLHLDYVYNNAAGNFPNNTIATPPTPNPPPLSIPVGMRPAGIILDEYDILSEGAFTMLGREVFPPDLLYIPLTGARQWVHLEHGGAVVPPQYADKPFRPNTPGPGPWSLGSFVQNGPLAESCTFYQITGGAYAGPSYGARQQIGNFLFAADNANNEIRVINSNTMELITTLSQGVRGPDQIAVSPDLRSLYISCAPSGTVCVYDVDPRSIDFFYPKATIKVGKQPKGISCQPEYEDIFVCNYGSSSVSIISASTNTVRKTLTALIDKPWDIVLTPRQQSFGWGTQTYYGYISNYGDDNILVFESGPDGVGGVGYDNILDPVGTTGEGGVTYEKITRPRGLCIDPLYLDNVNSAMNMTGGCFVAHSTTKGATVSRVNFISQQAPWGPIYLIPNSGSIGGTPGFGARQFEITAQWTAQDGFLSGYGDAADVALPDFNRYAWLNQNFSGNAYVTNYGAVGNNPIFLLPNNNKHPIRYVGPSPVPTWYPDLFFVSYMSTPNIDVVDIVNGDTTAITGLPKAATSLTTFFKN
jgi:YVTN family beta-propeller protein